MAILITAHVKGQTTEGYDAVLNAVKEEIEKAPGFILHFAHPAEGEWTVYELWESKKDADQWFAKYIIPNLPAGVHPKRTYTELHSLLGPALLKK